MAPIDADEVAARYLTLLDRSDLIVGMVDGDARLVHANAAMRARLGDDLEHKTTADAFPPDQFGEYYERIRPRLAAGESWRGVVDMVDATGTQFPVDLVVVGGAGPGGAIDWLAMVGRPVEPDATRTTVGVDALTGLPDRSALDVQLRHALGRVERSGGAVGLLMIDLDGFKAINDRHGHRVGDDVLRRVAGALQAGIRPGDLVARYGGDEFVVVCEPVESDRGLLIIADRLQLAVESIGEVVGSKLGASIGRAVGVGGDDPDDLFDRADHAMYDAKEAGGHRTRAAPGGRRTPSADRIRSELAVALSHGSIRLRWEPIIATDAARQVWGHRAVGRARLLGRMVHGDELFAMAHEAGLLEPVVQRLVRDTCQATHQRWRRHATIPRVHLPLPAAALASGGVSEVMHDVHVRLEMPPHLVSVEVPEAGLARSAEVAQAAVELREAGTTIVVDGVGRGASHLHRIERLEPVALRLDPSSVPADGASPGPPFASAVAVADRLGVPVIAAGVSRRARLERLDDLGCRLADGAAAGPPLLDARLDEELARRSRPLRRRASRR